MDPIKTCKRCRKQPNIDTNHSGSSNDHLSIVEVIEKPVNEKKNIPTSEFQINKLVMLLRKIYFSTS